MTFNYVWKTAVSMLLNIIVVFKTDQHNKFLLWLSNN